MNNKIDNIKAFDKSCRDGVARYDIEIECWCDAMVDDYGNIVNIMNIRGSSNIVDKLLHTMRFRGVKGVFQRRVKSKADIESVIKAIKDVHRKRSFIQSDPLHDTDLKVKNNCEFIDDREVDNKMQLIKPYHRQIQSLYFAESLDDAVDLAMTIGGFEFNNDVLQHAFEVRIERQVCSNTKI
jgi:nitrogen regulatory protein PII-like uncharacterized protein